MDNKLSTICETFRSHNSVTLHLLLEPIFGDLEKLLDKEQVELEKNLGVETVGTPKKNYFFIRLPNNETHVEIKERAKSCPLRYDSLVFGFKTDHGKKKGLSQI